MLTFEQIKELIELVVARKLAGLEVERAGFRLKIAGQEVAARPAAEVERAPGLSPQAAPSAAAGPAAQVAAPAPPSAHILTSPIVGTFYAASSPDAEPYAHVGARVKKGQVVCIIEAMKLMNEIESDVDGTIVEIFTKNAQPVEFGEQLFAIRVD